MRNAHASRKGLGTLIKIFENLFPISHLGVQESDGFESRRTVIIAQGKNMATISLCQGGIGVPAVTPEN
jgi:hypothetical protein